MYYPVIPLVKESYAADRQFALCESCFWSATILTIQKEMCTLQALVQFVQATIFLYFLLQEMTFTSWMLNPKVDWR